MRKRPIGIRTALGFRAHSGWAALVVLAGSPRAPVVIDRRRIELADSQIPGSKQPYHAAEGLHPKRAEKLLARCIHTTRLLACRAVRAVVRDLRKKGHRVVGSGLLLASGRPTATLTLATVLASHALIHTAEGELFRNVLIQASERAHLPVTRVRERELFACAAAKLRLPADKLQRCLSDLGRSLGPPWTQDQKCAALVAWLVLAAFPRR